jgi:hypothetical protein
MISAKEANKLLEASGARVQIYLDTKIEPIVKMAIEQGKKYCVIGIASIPSYQIPEPTELDKKVMEALRMLGYTVSFGMYGESFIPRGLDDEGLNNPRYRNYGFEIGW